MVGAKVRVVSAPGSAATAKLHAIALVSCIVVSPLGCSGPHRPADDADVAEDAGIDAEVDAARDVETDPWPDADEPPDGDVGETDVEADIEQDPDETTWLVELDGGSSASKVEQILPLPDGGMIVGGRLTLPWVGRLDERGRLLWAMSVETSGDWFGLERGPDGEILIGAAHVLAALDLDGSLLWQRRINPVGSAMAVLDDGSVVVVSAPGIEVARISAEAGILWSRRVPSDSVRLREVALATTVDGLVLVGAFATAEAPSRGQLTAMDLDGNLIWSEYLLDSSTYPIAGAATSDDGIVLVSDHSITRLDWIGTPLWCLSHGPSRQGEPWDWCYPRCDVHENFGVAVGPADEILVAGIITTSDESSGTWEGWAFSLRLSGVGEVLEALTINAPSSAQWDDAYAVAHAASGGWLVGGQLGFEFGPRNGFVASLSAEGRLDGSCDYLEEVTLDPETCEVTTMRVDLELEPGGYQVIDGTAAFEDAAPSVVELCH